MIEVEKIKGGLKVKSLVPKNDLIKTHTARRTGCTLMYLAGIPAIDIMKISGHKTEREFLNYIKTSKEETAQNLAKHPYFMGNSMRVAN
jgi:integrase